MIDFGLEIISAVILLSYLYWFFESSLFLKTTFSLYMMQGTDVVVSHYLISHFCTFLQPYQVSLLTTS